MSTNTNSVLKTALERLEDTFTSPVLRQNSYQDLQNALNTAEAIDKETARRLLAVCIHNLSEDIKYATNASTIIGALLVKVKKGQCSTTPNLVTSAISVIGLLKTIACSNQFDALKGILFNTLLSYPDDTLICIAAENTDKIIELLNAYINAGNKVVPITFLTTLLKILPPANKVHFVKEALALLFSKVIPFLMGCIQTELHVTSCVELLELLTEVLVDIEYAENPHWKVLIECIYNPKKYPSLMKSILENRNDYWHRLWIVFVKLLKDQITKVSNSSGSPINSMLPVVEAAFKMDPLNRCRAFQCWSVLIDNFSRESNEAYINKRLKLLLIPLKSSNAKVEETAISKFNTWWHLICRFHNKMEGLTDMILMPFFQFCFGKRVAKSPVAPGQFSQTLKQLSLQAFVEIFGHVDCEGCVNIPKLKNRLISTKVLVDYWNDWICFFKVALTTLLESESEQMMQQWACIWKSLVMTVGELPENNIRKDLFNELLALISIYVKDCQRNSKLADVVMNIMIKSLFEDDNKILSLLVTKETGPMYMILTMLSNSFGEEFYGGKTVDELLSFFKPITTFMMNHVLCCPNRITTWLLKLLPPNDYTLVLWMALVEAVCESKLDLAEATLLCIFSYPIQKLSKYSYEKAAVAAYKWFTTFSILGPKLGNMNFECIKIIMEQTELGCTAANIFMLHVSLAVVRQKFIQKIDNDCESVTQIFLTSMSSIDTYTSIEKVFPALIDTLILMSSKLKDNINVPDAKLFVSVLKVTAKLLLQQTINDTTILFVEKMLLSLLDILKIKDYQELAFIMNDEILACSSIAKKHASKIKSSLSMLTLHLTNNKNKNLSELNEPKSDTLNKVTGNDENMKKVAENVNNSKEGFNTPNGNYCKKSNKRAASIVNTVVENGEEYVVVKSNWKFNPRKLTENQKEKLKRKREDIPALYQDLSQSQDEFKLRAWKPDSQDTSTSSKSASITNNDDVTTVLNQISNTDVVPRIFENMLADNAKNNVGDKNSGSDVIVNNTSNVQKQTTSTKNVKSPRMALKDRVFRNVRNLVEKSSLPQDVTTSLLTDDMNNTLNENTAKTPTNKVKISTNAVNSAPPKIVSERPSRVIKKPKKFDDSELISLKKRRQSQDIRTEVLDSEIISLKKRQQSEEARIHATDINKISEKQKSQDLPVDESEKSCLKTMRESQDSQFSKTEIALENIQQSRNSQSDDVDLKMKEHSGVDASKVSHLNKNRQSQDTRLVDPEIISLKDSKQVEESRSDDGEISDLITKQQCKVLRADTPINNKLKKRRQSQESQSVIPEIITLTNDKQVQESRPDAAKTGSLKNRRKSQDSRSDSTKINSLKKRRQSRDSPSVDCEIITLKDSQQVEESRSDDGEITDLITKQQLQLSRSHTAKVSNLKKRRQSQDLRIISSVEFQSNSIDVLIPSYEKVKEKDEVVRKIVEKDKDNVMEYDKDLGDTNKDTFEFTGDKKQDTQNLDILADSQLKEQSHNNIALRDRSNDSQSNDQVFNDVPIQDISLNSQPKVQSPKTVPIQDSLPDSQPAEPSINNTPLQDILPDSQTQEPSSVLMQEDKEQITGDNSDKSETPTFKANDKDHEEKSAKKKESRIVKQLLIDMVEGHPLLQAQPNNEGNTPKRATRNSLVQTTNNNNRRQALSEKLEKFKSDLQIVPLPKSATKITKKLKEKASLSPKETVTMLSESREKELDERTSFSSDDQPMSEDVIESSQDSTITTMSVKSSKSILKKRPVVILDKTDILKTSALVTSPDKFNEQVISLTDTLSSDQENKDDSQFPKNITIDKPELDLTENMDTQPVKDIVNFGDTESCGVAVFVTDKQKPIFINIENTLKQLNTQETAEADTEPMDVNIEMTSSPKTQKSKNSSEINLWSDKNTQDDTTKTVLETLESSELVDQNYSPSKDEPERKQDFLNNTQEISPIKTLSPLREKQSPSPETSSDYVVIKLTSPVHSNGEPYEKCDSPEIFTEDKISPDKRNESPPRVEVIVNNTSPSSSLSLKKNRPQRRVSGRAAQMLDLCAIMNNDSSADVTDNRRTSTVNTPAKRNLKSMYSSSVANAREITDIELESAEREQFLEFKKSLPTANSSPAGPILKRKFTEISDEPTPSPASKRKRVSFHDPPVSTTVAVQKYIEPGAIRSPQHSTIKRRDRPIRNHTAMKSPKRLESVFRLENALSKTVESFTEDSVVAAMEDIEMSSMEQTPTPAIEVVKTSDLNDTDPICPALLHCNDPIENIAAELSSPAMKSLFIKEIEGKVGTIADLAKMTELEINRLCIKAPKVQVARKVLLEYAFDKVNPKLDNQDDLSMTKQRQAAIVHVDAEIQTSKSECSDSGMQTDANPVAIIETQTDCLPVAHTSAQTDESGCTSTKDVISSCLSERPDFIAQLSKCLEVSSVNMIADNALSFNAVLELLSKKMTIPNSVEVTNQVLELQSKSNLSCNSTQNKLSFVQNYLYNHFDSKDLILFCSQLLQKIYENST